MTIKLKRNGGLVIAESSMSNSTGYPRVGRGHDAETALDALRADIESDVSHLYGRIEELKLELEAIDRRAWEELADIPVPVSADSGIVSDARGRIVCIVPATADDRREAAPGETARAIVRALNDYMGRWE